MNSHYSTNSPFHRPPSHPDAILPTHPPPPHHNEPAFMQPLLPPRSLQDVHITCPPPLSAPIDCSVHPPTAQAQITAAHLHQLQSQARPHYGPEDSDEEYPLKFSSLEAFLTWRSELEDQESVEFVKADTCRSKTVPPGFNEIIKLTCSRNFKNSRCRYVNALPDRNRAGPNRNIEEEGCPASIWYRTYFESSIIQAKYFNQHSHPLGRENLLFTRRGRKFTGHERRMQHQDEFSRTGAAIHGTMLPAANGSMVSNIRETRNQEVLKIEPPPMASLKPPDESLQDSPVSIEYQQKQHLIGFAQLSPPQNGFSCPPFQSSPRLVTPPVSHLPEGYERNYGNDLGRISEPASVVPSIARSTVRNHAYRPPPPHLPTYTSNAQVHQPQPSYLSQPEPTNCQTQYLPTPTTPSTHIQSLHVQPYPHAYSEALYRGERETQNQAAPIPNTSDSHVSPISPITPQAQNLPGPPPAPVSDGRATLSQYLPCDRYTFDEDRWNRLEALFQAVRLRARTCAVPEHSIVPLEILLSQIYVDSSQQAYPPRAGSNQLSTYQATATVTVTGQGAMLKLPPDGFSERMLSYREH